MKKTLATTIFSVLLCALVAFGLTACGASSEEVDATVSASLSPISDRISELDSSVDDLIATDAELDAYIEALEARVEELEGEDALSKEITALKATIEGLKTKDTALEASIKEQKAALDKARTDLTAAYEKAIGDAITENNGKIDEDIAAAVKTAKEDLEARLDGIAAELGAIKEDLTTVNQQITAINGSIEELKGVDEELKATIEELQNRIDLLEKKIYCLENGHDYAFVDNGDGTHSSICKHCGAVESGTTENHSEYVDENCVCSKCGSQHYLRHAEEGSCTCFICFEEIHSYEGGCVCTRCGLVDHSSDPATGICSKCDSFAAVASVTDGETKRYFSTLDEVIIYANAVGDVEIVIENDCEHYQYERFENGNVIIDLNGKKIESVLVEGAHVTVRDSVGGGGTTASSTGWSGSLTIEGGKHEGQVISNDTIITGGEFKSFSVTTGEKATVSGGSFEMIRVFNSFGRIDVILAEGYCYYDQDGNAIDPSTVEPSGSWYTLYNVTVGKIK